MSVIEHPTNNNGNLLLIMCFLPFLAAPFKLLIIYNTGSLSPNKDKLSCCENSTPRKRVNEKCSRSSTDILQGGTFTASDQMYPP